MEAIKDKEQIRKFIMWWVLTYGDRFVAYHEFKNEDAWIEEPYPVQTLVRHKLFKNETIHFGMQIDKKGLRFLRSTD